MSEKPKSKNSHRKSDGELRPTSFYLLGIIFFIVFVSTFFFVDAWISAGNVPFMLPIWGFIGPVIIALFIIWQGLLVRAYKQHKKQLNPLTAGRIWLLSQAASRTGAIIAGMAIGVVASYLRQGGTSFLAEQIQNFLFAAIAAIGLTFAGWIVERWCIVNSPDNKDENIGKQNNNILSNEIR